MPQYQHNKALVSVQLQKHQKDNNICMSFWRRLSHGKFKKDGVLWYSAVSSGKVTAMILRLALSIVFTLSRPNWIQSIDLRHYCPLGFFPSSALFIIVLRLLIWHFNLQFRMKIEAASAAIAWLDEKQIHRTVIVTDYQSMPCKIDKRMLRRE